MTRPGWPHSYAMGSAKMQQIPHGTEEVRKIRQALLDQLPRLVEMDLSAMEARIMAQQQRPFMGDPGMYTGLKDRHGTPVHVGDVLSFDPGEWGGECEYVLRFEDGELVTKGTVFDITQWCVVVWPWDTDEARAWREEKAKQEG